MDFDVSSFSAAASFFEDVPEEDDLPFPIVIPGPIPDLVDLYALNPETKTNNNEEPRVSVPEDRHLPPVKFNIPGPIPDFVDLCALNLETSYNKKEERPRVYVPEDRDLPAVKSNMPGPIADFVDLHVQKQETSSKPNSKSRVSKRSTRIREPIPKKRNTRAREKISKEKLKMAISQDMPKFSPKGKRTKITKTCGKVIGNKKPWCKSRLMLLG